MVLSCLRCVDIYLLVVMVFCAPPPLMAAGAGRDSEFELLVLCDNWLENLDRTLVRS